MESDLHGTWLSCQQGCVSFAKWTAIFSHCERSFIFLAKFAENHEAASTDLKSSETRNVFNFGYLGVSNTPYHCAIDRKSSCVAGLSINCTCDEHLFDHKPRKQAKILKTTVRNTPKRRIELCLGVFYVITLDLSLIILEIMNR